MRIIGGKDYYDHGLAYGVDESVVLNRHGRNVLRDNFRVRITGGCPDCEIPKNKNSPWDRHDNLYEWEHRGWHVKLSSVHVVLCGRYYQGVRAFYARGVRSAYTSQTTAPYDLKDWQSDTFWDVATLDKFLRKHGGRVKPEKKQSSHNRWAVRQNPLVNFDRRDLTPEEKSWVIDEGITVATTTNQDYDPEDRQHRRHWVVNEDTLKSVQFIRVMDPVTAFQEISMWVGGVLPRPGNPMVEITDDKIKLAKHGMDKTSFRRAPEKVR